MSLTGKTAVVTGGGRGIGRAVATTLADLHANVAVLARSRDELEDVVQVILAGGGNAIAVECDVSDEQQVSRGFEMVREQFGQIDIVVNNAGTMTLKPLVETSVEEWQSILDVNLTGAFLVAREAFKAMTGRGGCIVNVGSLAGRRGYEEQGAYCASKHGLQGLTKVMAIEGQPLGIRVQLVSPGGVLTDLSASLRDSRSADPTEWMTPDEVADAVAFCVQQDGVAITDEIVLRRFRSEPWR